MSDPVRIDSIVLLAGLNAENLPEIIQAEDGQLQIGQAAQGNGVFTVAGYSRINVATTSTAVKAANANRKTMLLINISDTTIYIAEGAAPNATAGSEAGIPILADGNYEMSAEYGNLWLGTINAIHAGTGTKTLLVREGS